MTIHFIKDTTLHTSYECPPIGYRHMDWSCSNDSYDGAPDADMQIVGHGDTEQSAIDDYWRQYNEQ